MKSKNTIPVPDQSLQIYLDKMNKEFDLFQKEIVAASKELPFNQISHWYLSKDDFMDKYHKLVSTLELKTPEETEKGRKETFKRYVETLNMIYEVWFKIRPYVTL